jgi:hypothetical protein
MDLGICPRCGKNWPGGEYCPNCGFIPIGAGLSRLPKKKRKKIKPYREPGSLTPFLLFFAIIGGTGSVYQSKPWEDGWDRVRALFGHPRIHDIQGNWEVVKLLQGSPTESGPLYTAHADQATFVFGPNAAIELKIQRSGHEVDAKGSYEVEGTVVHVQNLHTPDDGGPQLPRNMDLSLGWNGENEVIVETSPNEHAYLHRETGDEMVALRSDRITATYSSDESDPHSLLTKPTGRP